MGLISVKGAGVWNVTGEKGGHDLTAWVLAASFEGACAKAEKALVDVFVKEGWADRGGPVRLYGVVLEGTIDR